VLLATSVLASLAGAESKPTPRPEQPRGTKVSVTVTGWERDTFADVVLADPELAACVLLSPGWWSVARPPEAVPEPQRLAGTVAEQVAAAPGATAPASISVALATADVKVPAAVSFGQVTLALLPQTIEAPAAGLAQAVASSLVAAATRPAPIDPRCGEPLLVLGEALAAAGSLSLATLPPTLRPVSDWLEDKEAEPPLATLVEQALDTARPWSSRRARLQAVARPDGAPRGLAHAAALLVEGFGEPGLARAAPFDLLLAWREDRGDSFPAMPAALKRALGRAAEAGLQRDPSDAERDALAVDVLARTLDNGAMPAPPAGHDLPLATRLLAAAVARPLGKGACAWVTGAVPPGLRTGCRSEGEGGGLVYVRPRPTGGSEIVARSQGGAEGVLLRWPGWVLFPVVDASRGEVLFIDATGINAVTLEGDAPARVVASGSFRHLTPSPDGTLLAASRWPSGTIVLVSSSGVRDLEVNGRGGLAWLEGDILIASDREQLVLASTGGRVRPLPVKIPCVTSLARGGAAVFATVASPCDPAIIAISPTDWTTNRLLVLPGDALGLHPRTDGSVVFGDPSGLWRWSGGDQAERIGAGLTPGPG